MTTYRFLPLAAALLLGATGCEQIQALMGGGDTPEITKDADDLLAKGDLPGASAKYAEIAGAHPDAAYARQGEAYALLLEGKYDEADKALQAAEASATATADPKIMGEIKLRRAIVALRKQDLDSVKQHGAASNLPAGQVLAGEVHLADAEPDEALKLFKAASGAGGIVGETAQGYISMLESQDPVTQGLAEATALWALGQRETAVESAEELVKSLPEEREDKSALLLLWAGRAVTAGRPASATGMLDAMSFPPEGQAWRVQATKAMVAIAEGNNEEGLALFAALESGGAPADGLADAKATAAALAKDKDTAKALVASLESAAVARGLWEAGAPQAAKDAAPSGSLKSWLEAQ
jgi:tetratricopeptide (TPR) repeat protein